MTMASSTDVAPQGCREESKDAVLVKDEKSFPDQPWLHVICIGPRAEALVEQVRLLSRSEPSPCVGSQISMSRSDIAAPHLSRMKHRQGVGSDTVCHRVSIKKK